MNLIAERLRRRSRTNSAGKDSLLEDAAREIERLEALVFGETAAIDPQETRRRPGRPRKETVT